MLSIKGTPKKVEVKSAKNKLLSISIISALSLLLFFGFIIPSIVLSNKPKNNSSSVSNEFAIASNSPTVNLPRDSVLGINVSISPESTNTPIPSITPTSTPIAFSINPTVTPTISSLPRNLKNTEFDFNLTTKEGWGIVSDTKVFDCEKAKVYLKIPCNENFVGDHISMIKIVDDKSYEVSITGATTDSNLTCKETENSAEYFVFIKGVKYDMPVCVEFDSENRRSTTVLNIQGVNSKWKALEISWNASGKPMAEEILDMLNLIT
jgi:hypothetical protein